MNGRTMREARKRLGYTQEQFGVMLGVSTDFIGQMERGAAPIATRTARALDGVLANMTNNESDARPATGDPLEDAIEAALKEAGIRYVRDRDGLVPSHLDFYLPDADVYIEVKRFHSDRIGGQMARAENVIAVQGLRAVQFMTAALSAMPHTAAAANTGTMD